MTSVKVHQAIAGMLMANRVETLFGLMGDANMFMIDSYVREFGGTFVPAGHEAGATLMALGYAAMSGRVGVCSVTHGPAMVNTATALAQGVRASLPLVVIAGETPVRDLQHSQRISQREFAAAAGAGVEQVRAPSTVAEDVLRALRRAVLERRPILLNAPIDFELQEASGFAPLRLQLPEDRGTVAASDDLDNAIGMIAAARRPVVLAGRGAISPEARTAILRLAERIGAPLATTVKAKDLFRGEPFDLGICGTISRDGTAQIIAESDCIVAFGASLTARTLPEGAFRRGKRIVQVNLEPAEIGRNLTPDAGLVGRLDEVARIIHRWLDEAGIPSSGHRSDELAGRIATPQPQAPAAPRPGTVVIAEAMQALDRLLPPDRLVVTDAGRFMLSVWRAIGVEGPRSFLITNDFGSIGFGVAQGIGAAFARPGQPVAVFCGDGGFMHGGLAEFNTAVRTGRDLIVVVCNDSAYGAEYMKFRDRDQAVDLSEFRWPDFADVARSLGGEGVTVAGEDDWPAVAHAVASRKAPLLIDIRCDPDLILWH